MAYVPPALRRRREAAAKGEKDNDGSPEYKTRGDAIELNLPSIRDIQAHFWPTKQEETKITGEDSNARPAENSFVNGSGGSNAQSPDIQSIVDPGPKPGVTQSPSTLNSTEAENDKLKYVLLFRDAHPRWKDEHIIYVKSDLHLLPIPADNNEPTPQPQTIKPLASGILIFDQAPSFGSNQGLSAHFKFLGYYSLINLQLLEPNSPELVRMLDQKWTRTNKSGRTRQVPRDAASWKKSMSYRWAILKFEKDEEMTSELGPPKIEISQDQEEHTRRGKSVNELLQDLRLQDLRRETGAEVDST